MMMADLGARIIKVESPKGGDDTRGWGPPFVGDSDEQQSTYFLSCNRNKESITLDLKSEAGRATLRRLLQSADVLVENFRPGTLDRLGFDAATVRDLNPGIIVLSISGFGHDGPEGDRAGYDQIVQGESGLMSLTGSGPDDPQRVGVPIGDLLAGMYGAYGVLSALYEREKNGRGQIVRTSLLASLIGVHAFQGTRWTVAREVGSAQGNHHPSIAPYGLFRCADGAIQIAVGSEGLWFKFAAFSGIDATDPRFKTNADRVGNHALLVTEIEGRFADRLAAELLLELTEAGIPAGKVRTIDEVYEWEQTRSQGLLLTVDHPALSPIELPGSPLRFFTHDVTETTKCDHMAPPMLGQHGDSVMEWLNLAATK